MQAHCIPTPAAEDGEAMQPPSDRGVAVVVDDDDEQLIMTQRSCRRRYLYTLQTELIQRLIMTRAYFNREPRTPQYANWCLEAVPQAHS